MNTSVRPIYAPSSPIYHPPPPTAPSTRTTPLLIDHGSTHLRFGWSSPSSSTSSNGPALIPALSSKYRDRKNNRLVLLAGADCWVDAPARSAVRSAWEGDVLLGGEVLEHLFDYMFLNLGLSSSDETMDAERIEHPILMTESLGNPLYSRSMVSELVFECYGIPAVGYGIDSLFSAYQNGVNSGLVISSGSSNTHVVPIANGKGRLRESRKFAWGASQAAEYMQKLVQLKYPNSTSRLSTFQTSAIIRDHCYCALDYQAELRELSDPQKMAEIDRAIQFPFTANATDEKTEEELQKQHERRVEQGRRLQEQTTKQRMEKLLQQEQDMEGFIELKRFKEKEKKADWLRRLQGEGFESEAELDTIMKKTERSLQRARNRELGIDENEDKAPPTFPLVEVPDHTLTEEELKEKKKQRLMKAAYEARQRAKAEKERERERQAEEARKDEERRISNPEVWLVDTRQEYKDVMARIKDRQKRKEQLTDRKSLAAQQRMKNIATLASDAGAGGNGKAKRRRGKNDDNFGAKDEDWMVYREIGNEDSGEEDEDVALLKSLETRLLSYDPTFTSEDTLERKALRRSQLLNAFSKGLAPSDPLEWYDPENPEHLARVHLNVERIRVPEVLWQPDIAGLDCGGIEELVGNVMRNVGVQKTFFVTGGNTLLRQFDDRLKSSITSLLPFNTPFSYVKAQDPIIDAWNGMKAWVNREDAEFKNSLLTRQEWEEMGGEYVKENRFGNLSPY
ncbi:actin-like ATPase domain-containing protein [Atractiella rhizophila]|nr:actin-like ATPase domain-containing protein [Atractiella rhizophila]